jgi:GMP synthase-like glutamine amidotransferase
MRRVYLGAYDALCLTLNYQHFSSMKPIAIFRHAPSEGAGYLSDFLDERKLPWQLICIDAGEPVPLEASQFSGLVFMGGPMSVNDSLSWIEPVLALIRDAVARDIPVLGHCLGGQLMSRALGGSVRKNSIKEIGWGEVSTAGNAESRAWFGDIKSAMVFHWHGETFSLPNGATHLLSSKHCTNQAYALGKHLALQCHVEMTEAMIREWCEIGAEEIAANLHSAGVQSAIAIQNQIPQNLPPLHRLAEQLYTKWIEGLPRQG